jgi:hypothetical protein
MNWQSNYKSERKEKCGPLKFNRIRVYFTVDVYDSVECIPLMECQELTLARAEKFFEKCLKQFPQGTCVKLRRVQTGGTIGGIVMSGHSDIIKSYVIRYYNMRNLTQLNEAQLIRLHRLAWNALIKYESTRAWLRLADVVYELDRRQLTY